MKNIKIIAAVGTKGLLGIKKTDGTFHLPWNIPEDLRYFAETTTDGVVIMGRTTWESIPEKYRPLKNRMNIVLTTTPGYEVPEGVHIHTNMVLALENAEKIGRPIWIIGGAQVYDQTLSCASELVLTRVKEDTLSSSTTKGKKILFPEFESRFVLAEAEGAQQSANGSVFWHERWERK